MDIQLLSSPLQGFTDYRFRNAFQKCFGGIDTYYAPYIRVKGNEVKASYIKDIMPENNPDICVVPQIMTNRADEFLQVANLVQQMGYNELNWNLGCPYPMVAKRGLGSGLIKDAQCVGEILQKVFAASNIAVSVKMRLGYHNNTEIFKALEVLNAFPVKNIAIHPRIGKQLYKGDADLNTFEKSLAHTKHEVHYNGDIVSVDSFRKLQQRFPSVNNWLLGRGILMNPFLPVMIKNNQAGLPANYKEVFMAFHNELLESCASTLSGNHQVLNKIKPYWEYFANLFPDNKKELKKIKKAGDLSGYRTAVRLLLVAGK